MFWQLLVDALVFCLGWIRNNYWDAEYDAMTRGEDVPGHDTSVDADRSGMVDCATYTGLHNALDSYQYLKIYTIWGGETLCSTTFLEHASLPLKAISSGIELLAEDALTCTSTLLRNNIKLSAIWSVMLNFCLFFV